MVNSTMNLMSESTMNIKENS